MRNVAYFPLLFFNLFFQLLIFINMILNFISSFQRILFLNLYTMQVIELTGNCWHLYFVLWISLQHLLKLDFFLTRIITSPFILNLGLIPEFILWVIFFFLTFWNCFKQFFSKGVEKALGFCSISSYWVHAWVNDSLANNEILYHNLLPQLYTLFLIFFWNIVSQQRWLCSLRVWFPTCFLCHRNPVSLQYLFKYSSHGFIECFPELSIVQVSGPVAVSMITSASASTELIF